MGPKPFSSEPASEFVFDKVFAVPVTPGITSESKNEPRQNDQENIQQEKSVDLKEEQEPESSDLDAENKYVS